MTEKQTTVAPCRLEQFVRCVVYDAVDFVWIADHYDIHLTGLCRERDELCRFTTDYDTAEIKIYHLTFREKIHWILRKKMFEWCVGYHWTYCKGKRKMNYGKRKPKWFWKLVMSAYYGKWLRHI